ncbi:MAG: hypothetical protein WCW14_01860 [Candidatus Paceibacterota bacterium]|jgi:hypothetical protein
MSDNIQYKKPKDSAEFLVVFAGVCGFAEMAFNIFETETSKSEIKDVFTLKSSLSYLISITKVIRGLRGDSYLLRDDSRESFYVKDGDIEYTQASLYKAEDYFSDRLMKALEILKTIDQKSYESLFELWKY